VFYLQAEVQYHYLRERVKDVRLPSHRLLDARANFVATPQLRLVLDDVGLSQVIPAIAQAFGGEPPDIIAIDPIRNVFDGGDAGGENDNGAMLFFLSQRVERIRQAVNPDAGVILAHHTKKLGKKQFEEDPFQALAGAGSLRGYYSTGMLLFRPDETRTTRQLIFELPSAAASATRSSRSSLMRPRRVVVTPPISLPKALKARLVWAVSARSAIVSRRSRPRAI